MTDIREGGCLCGRVRYEIDIEGHSSGLCHCTDCRKHTGAAFSMYTGVPVDQFRWIDEPLGEARASSKAKRRYCEACGTPFTWESPDYTQNMSILTYTLDSADGIEPSYEIFTQSRVSWVRPIAGVAQFEEEG